MNFYWVDIISSQHWMDFRKHNVSCQQLNTPHPTLINCSVSIYNHMASLLHLFHPPFPFGKDHSFRLYGACFWFELFLIYKWVKLVFCELVFLLLPFFHLSQSPHDSPMMLQMVDVVFSWLCSIPLCTCITFSVCLEDTLVVSNSWWFWKLKRLCSNYCFPFSGKYPKVEMLDIW